jgi:methylthioxylose transferase
VTEQAGTSAVPTAGRRLRTIALTLGVVGVGLFAFDWFSASSATARRGLISQRPPVYGRFQPSFSRLGIYALVLVGVAAAGAYVVARSERVRAAVLLPVAAGFLLSFAAAVAVVNGDTKAYVEPLLRARATSDYQADVPLVRKLGVRDFIREHPDIAPTFRSVHSKTHPPGPVVFFSYLDRLSPRHLIPRALVMAALSSLVLIPTWFIARSLAGQRAAAVAVTLLAVAPAPVIFTFTSMDAVYATILASVGALFVVGLEPGRPRWLIFLAGAAAGLATIMTYAAGFILVFAVLYALMTRGFRRSLAPLGLAAGGVVAALLAMRVALGFDLWASYHASYALVPNENDRSYLYWIFGNPAVWLTFAGLPIAAFALRELVFERPRLLLALFLPLLLADVTRIFPAETERIGQFAYPFLTAAAAAAYVRWEGSSDRRRPAVLAGLIAFAALQAIALEALYFTYW